MHSDTASKIEALERMLKALASELATAASAADAGEPPAEGLAAKVSQARANFIALSEVVSQLFAQVGRHRPLIATTEDLKRELGNAHLEQSREAALNCVRAEVERVMRLRMSGRDDLLARVRESAQEVLHLVAHRSTQSLPPEVEAVVAREHPICALLDLVEAWQTLEAQLWQQRVSSVEQGFGRELAAAAARGQVTLAALDFGRPDRARYSVTGADEARAEFPAAQVHPPLRAEVDPPLSDADRIDAGRADRVTPVAPSEPSRGERATTEVVVTRPEPLPSAETTQFDDRPQRLSAGDQCEPEALAADPAEYFAEPSGAPPHALTVADGPRTPIQGQELRTPSAGASPANAERMTGRMEVAYWRFLGSGRFGLAYHLARAAETLDGIDASWSALAEAAALVRLSNHHQADVPDRLRSSFTRLQSWPAEDVLGESPRSRAVRLALLAACMRPALFGRITSTSELFESTPVDAELPGLRELHKHIAQLAHLGFELSPTLLKGIREHAKWCETLDAHRARAADWVAHARQAKIIYAPTTAVWKTWLEDGGVLGKLLGVATSDQRRQVEWVREQLRPLEDQRRWERLLEKTDNDLRGRQASLRPIEARAVGGIMKKKDEALTYVYEWLDIIAAEPREASNYQHQRVDKIRHDVVRALPSAKADVAEAQRAGSSELAAAAALLGGTLDDLAALFDPHNEPRSIPGGLDTALNQDLLLVPGVQFASGDRVPAAWDRGLYDKLMDSAERVAGTSSWRVAFQAQMEAGNHSATERILDVLSDIGEPELDTLRRQRLEDIDDRRARLELRLTQVQTAVEGAVANNLLEESTRREWLGRIAAIDSASTLDFAHAAETIENVQTHIAERRRSAIADAGRRLDARTDLSPDSRARVRAALDKGNIDAANEYLHLGQEASAVAEPVDHLNVLKRFFPTFVDAVDALYARTSRGEGAPRERDVITATRQQSALGPIASGSLAADRAQDAARLLEQWYVAKANVSGGRKLVDTIEEVLARFGFRAPKLKRDDSEADRRRASFQLNCERLLAQDVCAIPDYGSQAKGAYRLLCLWETSSADEIFESVGHERSDLTMMVFSFARVSAQARRELARLCRAQRRSFVLIDETLLLFALQCPGHRLSWVFRAAVPFTVADPYTTTAGLVPPEMFFGRQREQDLLFAPHGTSLVYGGRQLGKTALLRHVERSHHDQTKGILVRYIDLKTEGIAIQRPCSDIWQVIAAALRDVGLSFPNLTNFDPLRKRIVDWLNEDPRRRIVLLLDEADAFFESDEKSGNTNELPAQRFYNTWQLKGLMDQTERRFKVVFAGLHNVQRISRDVNTPLAHLGEPICIGPLLERGEAREARRMIMFPLSALGYEFESPDLVLQILAYANWYPSLIQLCCKHVVEHLRKQAFDPRTTPPFVITAQHIEQAIQNSDLRRAILDRFRWTLDLDPRYRVLALRIALESEGRRERNEIADGLELAWIRDEALTLWRQGFGENTSRETFRTILDEMVGLGILATVSTDRYGLRNPNVLKLLGTRDEIESELWDALEKEPAPEYTPHTFRRAHPDDVWRRSPLTAQQEAEILASTKHGVSVIFGAPAAGLDDLVDFLDTPSLLDIEEPGRFEQQLADRLDQRREDRSRRAGGALTAFQVYVVRAGGGWSLEHLRRALDVIGRRRSTTEFSRVVFIGNAVDAWRWTAAPRELARELSSNPRLLLHALTPWSEVAVRRWMHDAGFGPGDSKAGLEQFRSATGNWGGILHLVGARSRDNASEWSARLAELVADLSTHEQLARWFGIVEDAWPVLRLLAEYGEPMTTADLRELSRPEDTEAVDRVVRWGEMMALCSRKGRAGVELDPFLRERIVRLR